MEMDHLYEIADFDRHNLKMQYVYTRALPKKPAAPAAAKPPAAAEPAGPAQS
jgi:hypothetical protein